MKPLTWGVLLLVMAVAASCEVGVGGGCLENPDDPRCRDGGVVDVRQDAQPIDRDLSEEGPVDRPVDARDVPDAPDIGDQANGDDVPCVPKLTCGNGDCGLIAADDGCGSPLDCGNPCTGGRICGSENTCVCDTGAEECGTDICHDLQTDEQHCGRCGHDCLGGECNGGLCGRVELATGQAAPTAIAVAAAGPATEVYWVNRDPSGAVMRVVIGADNQPGSPTAVVPGQSNPRAIAVDDTQVYWVNETGGQVRRATRVGFTVVDVATGQMGPSGIALDANSVYWVSRGGGAVRTKFKTDGPGVSPSSLASSQVSPIDVTVSGSEVLWVNNGNTGLDGTVMRLGAAAPLALAQPDPQALTADASTVYWVNQGGGTVMAISITGGTASPLASSQSSPIDVVQDQTHVYWVNHVAGGGLYRVAKAGGERETIAEGLDFPRGLFVDANSIYFVTDANAASQTGAVYRIAKP